MTALTEPCRMTGAELWEALREHRVTPTGGWAYRLWYDPQHYKAWCVGHGGLVMTVEGAGPTPEAAIAAALGVELQEDSQPKYAPGTLLRMMNAVGPPSGLEELWTDLRVHLQRDAFGVEDPQALALAEVVEGLESLKTDAASEASKALAMSANAKHYAARGMVKAYSIAITIIRRALEVPHD